MNPSRAPHPALVAAIAVLLATPPVLSQEKVERSGIEVLVADPKGKPVAGVPVRLTWKLHSHDFPQGSPRSTGKDGRVRLDPPSERFLRGGAFAVIEALVPTAKPVRAELGTGAAIRKVQQPVRLNMPAYGSVRVYVVDPDERPVKGITGAWLEPLHWPGRKKPKFQADEIVDDSATFRFVGVGFDFEARCSVSGRPRPQKSRGTGPRSQHELRVVTIEGVQAPPVLSCIVTNQAGELVRNEALGVLATARGRAEGFVQKTDDQGRLRVALPDRLGTDADNGQVVLIRRGPEPGAVQDAVATALANPGRTLQLRDEDLLVAGRAVDPEGRPVAGVRIRVQGGYHGPGSRVSGHPRFFRHELRTGPDGRFEFRTLAPSADTVTFELPFSRNDKAYAIVAGAEPKVGSKQHRLVVAEMATIRGSFAGLGPKQRFEGDIEIRDSDGKRVYAYTYEPAGGTFELSRIPAGTYQLSFALMGQRKPFFEVDGIEVGSGQVLADPRLQRIEIPKVVKQIQIRVLTPEGKPLPFVSVDISTRGLTQMKQTDPEGRVSVQIPLTGARVTVSDERRRYRPQFFSGQKTDLTVKMAPTWPFEIVLKNLPRLPKNLRLAASFTSPDVRRPRNTPASGSGSDKHYVGPDAKLVFRAEDPGKARIRIWPHYADDADIRKEQNGPNIVLEVEIDAKQPATQRFELALDEDARMTLGTFIDEAKARGK